MMYAATSPPACAKIVNIVTYECKWLPNGNADVHIELLDPRLPISVRYEDGIPTCFQLVEYDIDIAISCFDLYLAHIQKMCSKTNNMTRGFAPAPVIPLTFVMTGIQ
jgi:hypothetical protein